MARAGRARPGLTIESYGIPESIEEAEQRVTTLNADVRLIEAQLSDRYRMSPDTGKPMGVDEYEVWRSKAIYAMAVKRNEVDALKLWAKRHREQIMTLKCGELFAIRPGNIGDVLAVAYSLLCSWKPIDVSGQEIELMDVIQKTLETRWASKDGKR